MQAKIQRQIEIDRCRAVCRNYFEQQHLNVSYDQSIAVNIEWIPHVYAQNGEKYGVDVKTKPFLEAFWLDTYRLNVKPNKPEIKICLGINHGIDMTTGYEEQKKAVACGHWPLYRFDPRLREQGKNPLQLDSKPPTIKFEEYAYNENRYKSLQKSKPEAAEKLMNLANADAAGKYALMEQLAKLQCEKI